MADEFNDTSNKEQLGLVLCYRIGNITEVSVGCEIVSVLEYANPSATDCGAQTYNGTGNMAHQQKGCTAHFQQLAPKAPYFHCAFHDLNLALSKAWNISDIQSMLML